MSLDKKTALFEQKMKEAAPGYKKTEQKPVGQREWNPQSNGNLGAHSNDGYNAQTSKIPTGPPPKRSVSDLP